MPCTAIFLKAEDGSNLLARTFDFSSGYGAKLIVVPRGYPQALSDEEAKPAELPYACIGMGVQLGKAAFLLDGINEHGLCGVSNYYPEYASYKKAEPGRIAAAPYMALQYALGACRSLDEAEDAFLRRITIIPAKAALLDDVPPLHFMFADASGKCMIVEPDADGVKVYRDTVGVMTNAPSYPWHEANLRSYLGFRRESDAPADMAGRRLAPFSQNSGLWGLPGDYTTVSRFVRAAYLKHFAEPAANEPEAVELGMHILESVSSVKGLARIDSDHSAGYTVYTSAMCIESRRYYFSHYNDRRLSCADLISRSLDSNELASCAWSGGQDIRQLDDWNYTGELKK
jgi:choloylglycine hydrolase